MTNKREANFDWFKLICSSDAIIGPNPNNIEKWGQRRSSVAGLTKIFD